MSVSTSALLINIRGVLSDVSHLIPVQFFVFLLHLQTSVSSHRFSLALPTKIPRITSFFHATGHLLGLSHDDSKFCEERFGVNSDKRLMSSILTSIDASKPWSRCTSATITDFFDDGNGKGERFKGWAHICSSFYCVLTSLVHYLLLRVVSLGTKL